MLGVTEILQTPSGITFRLINLAIISIGMALVPSLWLSHFHLFLEDVFFVQKFKKRMIDHLYCDTASLLLFLTVAGLPLKFLTCRIKFLKCPSFQVQIQMQNRAKILYLNWDV